MKPLRTAAIRFVRSGFRLILAIRGIIYLFDLSKGIFHLVWHYYMGYLLIFKYYGYFFTYFRFIKRFFTHFGIKNRLIYLFGFIKWILFGITKGLFDYFEIIIKMVHLFWDYKGIIWLFWDFYKYGFLILGLQRDCSPGCTEHRGLGENCCHSHTNPSRDYFFRYK